MVKLGRFGLMRLRNWKTILAASLFLLSCTRVHAQAPTISAISPTSGPIGSVVTLTGSNFGATQGTSTVALNETTAVVTSWSGTTITAIVPTGASSGTFSVTVAGEGADSTTFTVTALPSGWSDTDIGSVGLTGSASYANGVFTVSGAGTGIYGTADAMHFAYQSLSGDGSIVARVVSLSGGNGNEQAAVMIRETLNSGATMADPFGETNSVSYEYRTTTGASATYGGGSSATLPYWLEVVRSGSNFSQYRSSDGVNWVQVGSTETITMATSVYIGLAVSGDTTTELATATFDNVSVNPASAPGPVITSVSATNGAVGSQVVIIGSAFGATQGGSLVLLNNTPVTIDSWSGTSITITIPAGATSGPLVVSVAPSMDDSNPVEFTVTSQPLPASWLDQDVGTVGSAGSSGYASSVFTVKGGGNGITGTTDGMHYVYEPLTGNGSIVARVLSLSGGGSEEQAGVMIRETLNAGATMATAWFSPSAIQFTYRASTGVSTTNAGSSSATLPYWVEVVRNGSSFSAYASLDGVNWVQVGSTETITMATNAFIGLVVSSDSSTELATATFDDVSINTSTAPAPVITSLSATNGSVGTQLTINGLNFGAAQGSSLVTLSDAPMTVNAWTDTGITITIPSGATSGPMVVLLGPSMNSSNPVTFTVTANPLPVPWLDQDIGQVGSIGNASYANGVFTVNGRGQISGTADALHFVYQPLAGDGSLVARVVSIQGTSSQAGVMIRETLTPGATMADSVELNNYVYFQYRPTTSGNETTNQSIPGTLPYWVQVVRSGNTFTAFTSPDGLYWTQLGTSETVDMAENVYIGLVATTQQSGLATVTYDNVSLNSSTTPAPQITVLSSTTGPVGSQILISGFGFGGSQGSSIVTLNAAPVTVNSWSDTGITVTIPAGATSGLMVVSVAPGMNDSNPVGFTVTSLPLPTSVLDADVGQTGLNGSATYSNGIYTVSGAGGGIIGTADAMHFAYVPLSGNGSIVARVLSVTGGSSLQAGVMIRETLNPGATMISTLYRSSYIYSLYRTSTGASAGEGYASSGALPYWVEAVRSGNSFSSYMSLDGVNWVQVGTTQTITMATDAYIGLVVSNDNTTSLATATFDNVSINLSASPAPVITTVSATTGPVGSQVVIYGSGFGIAQNGSTVMLNDTAATIDSWSATAITVTIPSGATSGPLAVLVAPSMNASNPFTFTITSQPLPASWLDQDIGVVGVAGSATYSGGVFTVNGAGNEKLGSTPEGLHFVYTALPGNGTLVARVTGVQGTSSSMAGVMIRQTLNSADLMAYTEYGPGEYSYFWCRETTGGESQDSYAAAGALPYWIEVIRNGSTFSGYESPDGVNWTQVWTNQTISMATNVYIGLGVTSDSTTTLATATFDNVSVTSGSSAPSPAITALSPAAAPVGAWVEFTGTSFEPVVGNSTVTFGGVQATISAQSDWTETSFRVPVPSGIPAGSTSAVVTVGGQASNSAPFTVLPNVSEVSPAFGVVGTSVTITGTSFGATQGSSSVYFNGTAATSIGSWSDTEIVATVPSGASTGAVTVTVNSAQSNPTTSFTVVNPAISSVSPAWGPISGTVTVNGTGFGPNEGNGEVYFNGTMANGVVSWNNNNIVVVVPYNATTGPVTVTTSGLTSNNVSFTVEGTLAVTGISPTAGPIGSPLTITGTGFGTSQASSTVTLNGVPLTVSSWSDTSIAAVIPSGSMTGAVTVNVEDLTVSGPVFAINSTVQLTDSLGNQTSYTAEMYGGKWYVGQSDGSGCSTCDIRGTISNTFSMTGNILSTTDELGYVTSYAYDANNDVTSIVQPTVSGGTPTTTYTYNNFGEVLTSTDPLGNVTTNTYDSHGNLLSVATPAPSGNTGASVTQFSYNSLGELTQIQDPLHRVTTMTYSSAGLIASITDPQGNTTSYGYDSRGNRTSVTDALNHTTTFTYDSGNRLTQITYPDTTTASFTYDYRGRRITATDQNGKTTTYAYDAADRLTSVTDAANNVTQYAYDTEDNLLTITDANNHSTNFTYDAFGRVTQTNFPSSHSETYAYDADNNLTSKTDRNGNTIQYVYDALNRLTQKNYPDSTSVEYTYDLVGKILSVNDPSGTYGFAYDNMGRLIGTTTQYSFLTGTNLTNSYTYDADSNRTGYTAPDGSTNTYTYDTLNRLSALANSWAGSFGFSYDALSRRTQMTRPNGVATSYSYDNLSRLLSVLHQLSGSTIDGAVYTVDSAGNRTSKADELANVTTNYGYDSIYELLQATQGSTTTESYTYDPVGNRLSSLGASSYTNNSSNELTATSNASYAYDYNGNTTSKTDSTGTTSYSWDYENRLTSVTLPNSGGTVTFKYDPFGRRIEKISPTTTSIFAYDGVNLIETANTAGGEVASYVQTENIDEPLAMGRNGTIDYYDQDGLGSITSLTASTGSIAQSYTYDSFGNTTNSSGSLTNFFRYTAREFDTETNLYYYRARYYDPSAGRFLSEDPTGFRAGINYYVYAGDTPTTVADATGLDGGWPGAVGSGLSWAWGHNGSTAYGPGSANSNQMSNSTIGQNLTQYFQGKNQGKPCKDWQGVSDYKGSFGIRGLVGNLSNGTAEFVGSARGDVSILSVDCGKGTVTAGFTLTNTTSLRSFLYGLWPNSWNVTTPGRPFSNWTQTYDWTQTFTCHCCD
jgi:RHS repeat-associated protein